MNMIKQSIQQKALNYLENLKNSHSKVMHLQHSALRMQKYFLPNKFKKTQEEIQLVFKLRSRMTDVKTNMKGIYDTYMNAKCVIKKKKTKHIF